MLYLCCFPLVSVFADLLVVEITSFKDTLIRGQLFYEYCNTANHVSCILIDTAQIPRKLLFPQY